MRIRACAVAIAGFGGRWVRTSQMDICVNTQRVVSVGGMRLRRWRQTRNGRLSTTATGAGNTAILWHKVWTVSGFVSIVALPGAARIHHRCSARPSPRPYHLPPRYRRTDRQNGFGLPPRQPRAEPCHAKHRGLLRECRALQAIRLRCLGKQLISCRAQTISNFNGNKAIRNGSEGRQKIKLVSSRSRFSLGPQAAKFISVPF